MYVTDNRYMYHSVTQHAKLAHFPAFPRLATFREKPNWLARLTVSRRRWLVEHKPGALPNPEPFTNYFYVSIDVTSQLNYNFISVSPLFGVVHNVISIYSSAQELYLRFLHDIVSSQCHVLVP